MLCVPQVVRVLKLNLRVWQCLLGLWCQLVLAELSWNRKKLSDKSWWMNFALNTIYFFFQYAFSFSCSKIVLGHYPLLLELVCSTHSMQKDHSLDWGKTVFLHCGSPSVYCSCKVFPVKWGSVCREKSVENSEWEITVGWLGTSQAEIAFLPKHKFLCDCWRQRAEAG